MYTDSFWKEQDGTLQEGTSNSLDPKKCSQLFQWCTVKL